LLSHILMQLASRLIDPREVPRLGGDINFSRVMLNNEIFIISRTGAVSEKKFANCMSRGALSFWRGVASRRTPGEPERSDPAALERASFESATPARIKKGGLRRLQDFSQRVVPVVCVCDLLVRTMLSGSCRFSRRSHFSHRGEHRREGKPFRRRIFQFPERAG
jgi:hypothetical protein